MRKTVIVAAVLLLLSVTPWAVGAGTVQIAWDPPTHRIVGNDCSTQGDAITTAEAMLVEYTFSYRVKGTQAWTNVEATQPTVTLESLPYNTIYQCSVGAHWPGETALCATGLVEFTTGIGPPPGNCSNLRKLP